MDLIDRFANLFVGNQRSKGVFHKNGQMSTLREPTNIKDFENHLSGELGLGVVPILDDCRCLWGAIDVDAHGTDEEINLLSLEKNVKAADLPLVVCRSKSGGAHLYLFCSEPVPAKLLKSTLNKWAKRLQYSGAEIFPKQEKLSGEGEEKQLGNWINLCYFDEKKTNRYCIEGGKKISLEYFVEIAESRKTSAVVLVEKSEGDHSGAPPCIQKMMSSEVAFGMRNEALYNICNYLKQAYPETWKDKAFDINAKIFPVPLSHSEAKKTITSVSRRNYQYKCKEEPCKSLCNSSVCVTRKFGITKEESNEIFIGEHPEFTGLKKYLTDPVRWGLGVAGVEVTLNTSEIINYNKIREAIIEKLTLVVPPMKNDKWLVILKGLTEQVITIDAPEEASSAGLVWQHLIQFSQRANLDSDGNNIADRELLLRGIPVVQNKNDERVIYFRGSDFVNYLKKNRAEELRGPNLWFALKNHGVEHSKLRIGKTVRPVWSIGIDKIYNHEPVDVPIELEY